MKRVAMLSLSPLAHDARVLRHARALAETGYDVTIVAETPLPENSQGIPVIPLPGDKSDIRIRAGIALRQAPATLLPATAQLLYWLSATRAAAWRALIRVRPDLVIANDWRSLPLASAAMRRFGSRVIYDSHEFATQEFAASRTWRLLAQRHVIAIESHHIKGVEAVITVSEGLAEELARLYRLAPRPLVIPNIPDVTPIAPHPTRERVTVLYHGIVAPGRGLEALAQAAGQWPKHLRLIIRGPAHAGFDRVLLQKIADCGADAIVDPAVPPDQLIGAAAGADIGIFILDSALGQASVALPNKLFEYAAAGLMLVSSDLPEIRRVFEANGFGLLLPDGRPETIAQVLGALSPAMIDRQREKAADFAQKNAFSPVRRTFLQLVAETLAATPNEKNFNDSNNLSHMTAADASRNRAL